MAAPPLPSPLSPQLRQKLEATRRKHVGVTTGIGAALTLGALILMFGTSMLLDWFLDFPWLLRAAILLAELGTLGYLGRNYIYTPLAHQPDDDTVALMIEKATPSFRTRLIASIQLSRPEVLAEVIAPSLVFALLAETQTLAAPLDFTRIIKTDRLQKFTGLASGLLLLGSFLFWRGDDVSLDLLKRAFLSTIPVPRMTRLTFVSGNLKVTQGDEVKIEATVKGVIPSHGQVLGKYPNGQTVEATLEPEKENPAKFSRIIPNAQESFSYFVRLNDGISKTFQVVVMPRPVILSLDCHQIYPPYTHLGTVRRSVNDLTLLAGSKLALNITMNTPVRSAAVRLLGLDREVPMQIDRQNPKQLTAEFEIPPKDLTGFTLHLVDVNGLESKTGTIYQIEVVPDKPPTIRITYPDRKEELVTQQAIILIGFEAADDFGLASISLHYKIDQLDKGAEKSVELDLAGQTPKSLRRRHEWKLRSFTPMLPEDSLIEYWLEARDANNATGPGRGVSEHYQAKVVSEAAKRAELMNRLNDSLGSIKDVATDQEVLTQNLGALITQKPREK